MAVLIKDEANPNIGSEQGVRKALNSERNLHMTRRDKNQGSLV